MSNKQIPNPKKNPIRHLRKASTKEIEAELDSRTEEKLVANDKSGGQWLDYNVIQMLNNELTGRYVKTTTRLALLIAVVSLVVSLMSLAFGILGLGFIERLFT